ncbi:uncharacterized protein BDR25DRAFT_318026 [Lindgomyces ingoldianus]|uniref:Uncharacterized protein n=1 Tax=Lindgomyces ingoldianus TaxID=673940 RepID=A0ACB6QIB2_9PLEO|nr:uncharacterized protein BDR25DRAFT_318026 [Lindgomyces ingoldianus]KAF2465876.1 hypothetical protein BDR25DRAFT_318026 [Lindgomyces ingoldianus]
MKINDEARRSTRAVVLGTAKVMGFNELQEARAKRAEIEATKKAKGKAKRGRPKKASLEEGQATVGEVKRGRKRKGTPDAEELSAKVARQSEAPVEESVAWRAPEARMW